jgi:hypothetical protein
MPVNECDTPALEIELVQREACGQQTVVARSPPLAIFASRPYPMDVAESVPTRIPPLYFF